MTAPAKSGRRRRAGAPDFAGMLALVDGGLRQADLARRFGISPAAVSAGLARARNLRRLGLAGIDGEGIANAAAQTGAPRAAVAAFLAAAGRWSGDASAVPDGRAFLRSVRSPFAFAGPPCRPADVLAALRRAAEALASGLRAANEPAGLNATRECIAGALAQRAEGRLDARALARRLNVAGADDDKALRYASVAGAVLACDYALGAAASPSIRAAVERMRPILEAVAAAAPRKPATAIARELGTTRWRIAVARRAHEFLPQIFAALEEGRP